EQAVRLLGEHLRPVAEPDVKKIKALIEQLGSTTFAEREKASRELERVGDLAENPLRQLVAGNPATEVRRRAEDLLSRLDATVTDAENLRTLRALETLDLIPGEDADKLLRKLADGGWPGSRLTQDATRSLARRRTAAP